MALVALIVGLALGSIPTAWLAGRAGGRNVLAEGSGNVGAVNVARTVGGGLGLALGLATAGLDLAKGAAAVLLAQRLSDDRAVWFVAALAVTFGHQRMLFFRFRAGGKGLATSAGAVLVLAPGLVGLVAAIIALVWILVRNVYVGVVAGYFAAPIILFLALSDLQWFGFSAALAAMVIARHVPDLKRFLEARLGTPEPGFEAAPEGGAAPEPDPVGPSPAPAADPTPGEPDRRPPAGGGSG